MEYDKLEEKDELLFKEKVSEENNINKDFRPNLSHMAMQSALRIGQIVVEQGVDDEPQTPQEFVLSRSPQQGMAMAPIVYSFVLQLVRQEAEAVLGVETLQDVEDLSTSLSLPELRDYSTPGWQQYSDESFIQENYQTSYGSSNDNSSVPQGEDTVASTSSICQRWRFLVWEVTKGCQKAILWLKYLFVNWKNI